MEQNTGLTVALILVAIAVLMQAGAMLGIWLAIRKIPGQVENVRSDVKQRLDPLAQSALEIVNNSREPLRTISANLAEISQSFATERPMPIRWPPSCWKRAGHRSSAWTGWLPTWWKKLRPPRTLSKRVCSPPSRKSRRWSRACAPALEFLFTRRRVTNVSEATQDEQLFIDLAARWR